MAERVVELVRNADSLSAGHATGLPAEVEAELQALDKLNADVLWAVARSRMHTVRQRRWRRLRPAACATSGRRTW
jgi:hypothetical protein